MNSKFKSLMEKRKSEDGEMDPMRKEAKMSMLKELQSQMAGMLKDDLHGHSMKKVEVQAPDKEGLSHGLEKAKEMVDQHTNSDELGQDEADEHAVGNNEHGVSPEMEEAAEEGDSTEPEHEGEEDSHLSPEEEVELQRLLDKKQGR